MYKQMLFALAAATASSAAAQARPDPKDPKAKVPPVEYRSAFEGYRAYAEPEIAPWRAANEEVGRAGGHGSAAGDQKEADKPAAPKPPAHGEHK